MRYVYFWSKTPGQPPNAGGFLRCDSVKELDEFVEQCQRLSLSYKVSDQKENHDYL